MLGNGTMNVAKPLLLSLGLTVGLPVLPAQAGNFTPPQGCSLFMTVQSRACRVSNHYKCTQDAPGDQWRADFDQEGKFFESRIDSETQWMETIESNPTVRQTLDPSPADPASFSELLATGQDSFDFNLSKDNGEASRVTGYDKLTGQEVVIDGITLKQTEYQYEEVDAFGNVIGRAHGNEYIHPEWRLFFSGQSQWDQGDGTFLPLDGRPMQFLFPGDKGFGATQPIFDCDPVMSALPQLSVPRG